MQIKNTNHLGQHITYAYTRIDRNAVSRHCVHCNLHNNLNWSWLLKDNTLNKSLNVLKRVLCLDIISINHSLCIVTYISGLYGYP